MILLQKRRIILVLIFTFCSIFIYFLSDSQINNTIETVGLPVTNKVVVLDARTSEEKMQAQNRQMEQQKQIQI